MACYTADLCDAHRDEITVLDPLFTNFGGRQKCHGEIVTLMLDEDNSALITLLKTKVEGKIAVVDVGAKYCAVVGENLINLAHQNGWQAILINGYVRDIHATKVVDVGLFALGTCPQKSAKKADGVPDVALFFANATFHSGDFLYCDLDGIILSPKSLF